MKKTIFFIIILIVIIALGIFVGRKMNNPENTAEPAYSSKVDNDEKIEEGNNTASDVKNTVQNNVAGQEQDEVEEDDEPKTDLEKAIDIAKKDWGEDKTIYFSEEGTTEEGKYIISVRDKDTTNARIWYIIDVTNGTFEKE